jgi:hypothetical protein
MWRSSAGRRSRASTIRRHASFGFSGPAFHEGIETHEPDGEPVRIYDPEKTLGFRTTSIVVDYLFNQGEAPNSSAHLLMLSGGPLRWRTEENALGRRLGIFRAGMLRSAET